MQFSLFSTLSVLAIAASAHIVPIKQTETSTPGIIVQPQNRVTAKAVQPASTATEAGFMRRHRKELAVGFGLGLPTIALLASLPYLANKSTEKANKDSTTGYDKDSTTGYDKEAEKMKNLFANWLREGIYPKYSTNFKTLGMYSE